MPASVAGYVHGPALDGALGMDAAAKVMKENAPSLRGPASIKRQPAEGTCCPLAVRTCPAMRATSVDLADPDSAVSRLVTEPAAGSDLMPEQGTHRLN